MTLSRRSALLSGLAAVASSPALAGRRMRGRQIGVVRPPADYVVTNRAQLVAIFALGSAALSGKVIECADGAEAAYGTAPIYVNSTGASGGTPLTPATALTIRAANRRGAQLPGLYLVHTANITLSGLKIVLLQANAAGLAAVVSIASSTNAQVLDCEVGSDPFTGTDFTGYVNVSNVVGTFIDGELVVTNVAGSGNSGYYRAGRPHSSATLFAISAADGGPVGGGASDYGDFWFDSHLPTSRTITGQTSGATATTGQISSFLTFLVGVGGGAGETNVCSGLTVTDCYIHDVQNGIAAVGTGISMLRCLVVGFYDAPFAMNGDCSNLNIKDNRAINNWSHNTDGQPVGTNGPHASVGGLSFAHYMSSNVNIEGNVFLVGLARFNYDGQMGVVSGPKFNGQSSASMTASLSGGNLLTVTAISSIWTLRAGQRLFLRAGSGLPPGTTITGQVSGTTGKTGVYTISSSVADVASTTAFQAQSRVTNATIRSNFTDTNLNIAWDITFLADSVFAYNTMVSTRDTHNPQGVSSPAIYYGNNDRVLIHDNISIATALGAGDLEDDAWEIAGSINNVILPLTVTSGSGSYEAAFDGVGGPTPFSNATLANALAMFTYKAGGPLAGRGVGHAAYYNFATGVSSYPGFTPPATATPSGVSLPAINFDGTNYSKYTAVAPATLYDLADPNVWTLMMCFQMHTADGSDCYLYTGDASIRRLPDNSIRIGITGASGATSVQIDSRLTVTQADGMMLLLVSVDIAHNRIRLLKNQINDGLANVPTWTGEARIMTALTAFLPSTVTTPHAKLDVSQLYVSDQFVDTQDPAVLGRLIAQDNLPVDLGSDGHLLTGVQPKMYARGNAAAWWSGGAGIQLGTAVKKLIPQTLPTDV